MLIEVDVIVGRGVCEGSEDTEDTSTMSKLRDLSGVAVLLMTNMASDVGDILFAIDWHEMSKAAAKNRLRY